MSKHKPRRRLTQVFAVMASERSTWPVPNAIFGTALNLPNLHFTRLSYRELNIRELASLRFATRRTGGDAVCEEAAPSQKCTASKKALEETSSA